MKVFFTIIIALSMLLCAEQAQAAMFKVVVFGDSLTSGYQMQTEEAYPAKLQRKLQEVGFDVEVVNMSIAGETSADGVERVDTVLAKQPDIVVLELGSNDLLRGIGSNIIERNLRIIIGRLKEKGIYVILFGMKAPPNLGTGYSYQVDAMYRALQTVDGVSSYYPFTLDGIVGDPDLNLADGYHPNTKGLDVMVEKTYRLVDAALRWKWSVANQQQEQPAAPPSY